MPRLNYIRKKAEKKLPERSASKLKPTKKPPRRPCRQQGEPLTLRSSSTAPGKGLCARPSFPLLRRLTVTAPPSPKTACPPTAKAGWPCCWCSYPRWRSSMDPILDPMQSVLEVIISFGQLPMAYPTRAMVTATRARFVQAHR